MNYCNTKLSCCCRKCFVLEVRRRDKKIEFVIVHAKTGACVYRLFLCDSSDRKMGDFSFVCPHIISSWYHPSLRLHECILEDIWISNFDMTIVMSYPPNGNDLSYLTYMRPTIVLLSVDGTSWFQTQQERRRLFVSMDGRLCGCDIPISSWDGFSSLL